ncbi:hypothetical protein BWQ96_06271 [Gracilariopsis chorda]|uniref:Chitin-binding type-4 domain-containing protein n=1 Tax=Gracilariopsis chorda TaxID=448386 RepID=A0A2V3IPE6_9FLOR|nr:hypothetical protein BWQ96_06271 [Gracilariopsis chorda]|eukprot:PXF43961.1 hypothetical protein BWQ96_06271 [Gracilariopsis chorda]
MAPLFSAPAPMLPIVASALLLLSSLLSSANAHGMMCSPRQRGAYHSVKCQSDLPDPSQPVIDHCAHCLNGGTVATVKTHLPADGWKVYEPVKDFGGTATRAGLCGDPKGRIDHMIGGDFMPYPTVPIVAHYKQGGAVDFSAEIDTNHNGYFEFFLCNLDACGTPDIDGSCFTGNHCVKLNRVPHPSCENPSSATIHECGPIDAAYPGRWYLPCRNTGHVGVHIVGGDSGTMRYQLPDGFSCKHCVIQWYWATANSCAPRGFKDYFVNYNFPFGTTCDSDGGGRGTYRADMSECGGDSLPEEFWSCADVQITPDGASAGAVQALANPQPDPAVMSNDEDAVKQDPQGMLNKASEGLETDMTMAAHEDSGKRKAEELGAAQGNCIAEDNPCTGEKDCCDIQQFCVRTDKAGGFTCRFWWSLWEDSERRMKVSM